MNKQEIKNTALQMLKEDKINAEIFDEYKKLVEAEKKKPFLSKIFPWKITITRR